MSRPSARLLCLSALSMALAACGSSDGGDRVTEGEEGGPRSTPQTGGAASISTGGTNSGGRLGAGGSAGRDGGVAHTGGTAGADRDAGGGAPDGGTSGGNDDAGTSGGASGAGGAGDVDASNSGGAGGSTGGGATVVVSKRIHQDWGAGSWSSSTVPITGVRAGDALFVLGLYWITPVQGTAPAPSDDRGPLVAAVNQEPMYGRSYPPVAAQLYYVLDAAAGTHIITPPDLNGGSGDGTLYILHVRGLGPSARLVAAGEAHMLGTALPGVTTRLAGTAQAGDFVVAIGGEDNAVVFPDAGVSDPPAGWQSIGVQNDASNNVPSEAAYRVAPSTGNQQVSWTWDDPTANVTAAAVAAFR